MSEQLRRDRRVAFALSRWAQARPRTEEQAAAGPDLEATMRRLSLFLVLLFPALALGGQTAVDKLIRHDGTVGLTSAPVLVAVAFDGV